MEWAPVLAVLDHLFKVHDVEVAADHQLHHGLLVEALL